MIVRMKEVLLFTLSSSVDETVRQLGKLGVVEVKEIKQPESEVINRRMQELHRAESAISILESYIHKNNGKATDRVKYKSRDPKRMADRILTTDDLRLQCQNKLEHLNQQLDWYETWGEQVNVKDFEYLRKKGVYIHLYQVDKQLVQALSEDHCIEAFPARNGKVPIALFTRDESEKLKLKEAPLPKWPLQEVKQQIKRKKRQLQEIELYLKDQSNNIELLKDYHHFLKNRLGTQQVLEGMGEVEDQIKYLRGFIPRHSVDAFLSVAKEQNWGYQISEPEDPDEVPVYVKNPKWISIINPVMKFIDIVPGYKEVDVSIYFLIAFALFFAMLVGDAGYGAIFLLIAFLLRKKMAPQMRLLIYVLSGATIVWGVLSGTYFGAEQIAAIPFFNNLIIEEISSFGVDNISFMMHLSFLIGAIHLTIAHGIRSVQFINSIKALSEVGWILLVWGLFFVTETLVLGKNMPGWNNWLFISGAALVTLFSVESKNLFKSMLVSVSNLPLSLISGFSDIVSYVRLFAVGMATAAVAASFNNMVIPPGGLADMAVIDLIMAAVGLFLGHGLNIILALMAVMVHGIRLNMLEFAGHLGVQFSGQAYQPFKLISYQNSFEGGQESS
jgi:V/A-type H+-transporting ATPase subunit I